MRHYKKVTIPQHTEEQLEKTTCDLCGAIAEKGKWDSSLWAVDETEIEITIRQMDGKNYPSGGSGTEYKVDMCPNCFKNKLIPWLDSQGCKSKINNWDW